MTPRRIARAQVWQALAELDDEGLVRLASRARKLLKRQRIIVEADRRLAELDAEERATRALRPRMMPRP